MHFYHALKSSDTHQPKRQRHSTLTQTSWLDAWECFLEPDTSWQWIQQCWISNFPYLFISRKQWGWFTRSIHMGPCLMYPKQSVCNHSAPLCTFVGRKHVIPSLPFLEPPGGVRHPRREGAERLHNKAIFMRWQSPVWIMLLDNFELNVTKFHWMVELRSFQLERPL